jgi:hypothetical protein
MPFLAFSLFWFLCAPPAIARAAKTISREQIFEPLRAFVEARYPGTLLDYLIGCTPCLAYWAGAGLALAAILLNGSSVHHAAGAMTTLVFFVYWLGAVEIAIEFWIVRLEK